MLHIFYGDMPEAIFNTAIFFKNSYVDVDRSTVLGAGGGIDSSVLEKFAPECLSGGVKTLMLVKFMSELVFNA